MILCLADREVIGSAADLFFTRADSRVYKLFRRGSTDRSTRRACAVFGAERDAYEIIQKTDMLGPHAPAFFGCPEVTSVQDDSGVDVTSAYLGDCCYCLELVSGHALGVFEVPTRCQRGVLALMSRFEAAGVRHVGDASVFYWDDPDRMKLIDFATYDALAVYS